MSPKIFPVIKKVITEIIQGGGGPNPADDFRLRINFSESNVSPTDGVGVAFTFPETIAATTDGMKLALTFPESNLAPSEVLNKLTIVSGESNAAPTDAATFGMQYTVGETNVAPTDGAKLNIAGFADSNAAPTDGQEATATWRQGATTAASTGTNAWATPANAQGLKNATLATSADTSAIAAWSSALTLDPYPDPDSSFSSWTISTVKLYEFAKYAPGTLPDAGSWVLEYRLGTGSYAIAESINTAFDSKTTAKVFDITNLKPGGGAWTWADFNNFNARVRYISTLAETSSAEVDSIELEVVATKNPL
jgi:hypothetical protein